MDKMKEICTENNSITRIGPQGTLAYHQEAEVFPVNNDSTNQCAQHKLKIVYKT